MKIVQINAVYQRGSTGRTVMELHEALLAQGHESYVFVAQRHLPDRNVYTVGSPVGWKLHALLSRLTGLQGYFSHFATWRLLRRLRDIRPDAVHLHNLHGNYINLPMLLRHFKTNNIPTLITLHDCWFYTGKCCHYTQDHCSRWQDACGKCPAVHKWNKSWFWDRSAKMLADKKKWFGALGNLTVVGVSDWITNEARRSFLASTARIIRIYNWVDLSIFQPLAYEKPQRPRVLSVAHGWSEQKGLADIIRIAQRMPHADFVLVGGMPRSPAFPPNVKPVGLIHDVRELAGYYARADVFLSLSVQETFGKVIAEALACGTPVVVYDATAMPELVAEGRGAVVPLKDWEKAAEAVQGILQKGKEAYTRSCRAFALQAFDKERLIAEQISDYQALLAKHAVL